MKRDRFIGRSNEKLYYKIIIVISIIITMMRNYWMRLSMISWTIKTEADNINMRLLSIIIIDIERLPSPISIHHMTVIAWTCVNFLWSAVFHMIINSLLLILVNKLILNIFSFLSERETADKNYALGYYMNAHKVGGTYMMHGNTQQPQ